MIEVNGLKIDNSSLTGESQAIKKSISMTDENPLETRNLAFYLSSVISGTGKGIVIRIGDDTAIGRIAKLVSSTVLIQFF